MVYAVGAVCRSVNQTIQSFSQPDKLARLVSYAALGAFAALSLYAVATGAAFNVVAGAVGGLILSFAFFEGVHERPVAVLPNQEIAQLRRQLSEAREQIKRILEEAANFVKEPRRKRRRKA